MRKKEEEKRKIGRKEKIQETLKREKNGYKERGITLVALVITIIIIIILATVAINFAFGENGLINRAQDASGMYANDTKHTEGSITNVESYIKDILIGVGVETPEQTATTVVDAKANGLKYSETTQITDASDDTMWIPGGFGIASDSATDIDDGVVITDGTNEFVWIPVNDTDLAEMYSTTTPEAALDTNLAQSTLGEAVTTTKIYSKLRVRSGDSYTAGAPNSTNVREPDILISTTEGDASTTANYGINLIKSELGYTGTSEQILKDFAQDMVDEYLDVFESIKEYDGFYIGRYELTGTAKNPTVQRHQPVLTAANTSANSWYGLKAACNRVVTGEDKDAQSYMIYGNQWDEVMDWLVDTQGKTDYEVNTDSSTWGNYSNSSGAAAVEGAGELQDSGHSDAWSANNIYDLAGNYRDWIQEAIYDHSRVSRGGYCNNSGSGNPASDRDYDRPYNTGSIGSSRVALYIK